MTGLMVIFMFIAISYILEAQKSNQQKQLILDELEEKQRQLEITLDNLKKRQQKQVIIFENFQDSKQSIYLELKQKFSDKMNEWDIELDKDLSIKFTNPEVLFELGKTTINPYFMKILDEFLPRYFNIILQPKYRHTINEIRIEGHTDTAPVFRYDTDPYIGNVILSQLRSTAVLKYFH